MLHRAPHTLAGKLRQPDRAPQGAVFLASWLGLVPAKPKTRAVQELSQPSEDLAEVADGLHSLVLSFKH